MDVDSFTDWLGQRVEVGDYVSYPVASGRCINIALGKVARILANGDGSIASVSLNRLQGEGSRWNHSSYGQTAYRDKRTGKGIDPHGVKDGRHYEDARCYQHKETGERLTYEDCNALGYKWYIDYEYVGFVMKDYVEEYERPPKPSIITVVENLTRVPTELIEGREDE